MPVNIARRLAIWLTHRRLNQLGAEVNEGVADEASGQVQEGFGKAWRKVGEGIEDAGDRVKD